MLTAAIAKGASAYMVSVSVTRLIGSSSSLLLLLLRDDEDALSPEKGDSGHLLTSRKDRV